MLALRVRSGSYRTALVLVAILQPEEDQSHQRQQQIGPEDHPGIPGSEIPLANHALNMDPRSPPEKRRHRQYRGKTHLDAFPRRDHTDQSKPDTRKTELDLERAIRPANQFGCHLGHGRVEEAIIQEGTANREKEEPEEKLLDHHGRADRFGATLGARGAQLGLSRVRLRPMWSPWRRILETHLLFANNWTNTEKIQVVMIVISKLTPWVLP